MLIILTWGKYYLVRHPSKKQNLTHGQRQEHIHFKIHLNNQKTLTSYVLPSKKLDPKTKTRLIYMGKFNVEDALKNGQIIERGVIDKIGPHKYTIGNKFTISIYQPPFLKGQKMFFVSYSPIERPERWWRKYKKHEKLLEKEQ